MAILIPATPEGMVEWNQYPPPDSPVTLMPITVGAYKLFDISNDLIGIAHADGETGAFSKAEFEAHVAAFFGLNF